jgi:hypothetical protein
MPETQVYSSSQTNYGTVLIAVVIGAGLWVAWPLLSGLGQLLGLVTGAINDVVGLGGDAKTALTGLADAPGGIVGSITSIGQSTPVNSAAAVAWLYAHPDYISKSWPSGPPIWGRGYPIPTGGPNNAPGGMVEFPLPDGTTLVNNQLVKKTSK